MNSSLYTPSFADPKGALIKIPSVGIVLARGAGAPSNSVAEYAKGCLYEDSTNGVSYINTGTVSSSTWVLLGQSGGSLTTLTASSISFTTLYDGTTNLAASTAELNRAAQLSTRVVTVAPGGSDSTLTVTAAAHDGRTVVIDNATKSAIVTLPAATGSGARYKFFIGTSITNGAGNSITFTATGAHLFGNAFVFSDNAAQAAIGWPAAGSTNITFNGTTTGGLKGDIVEIEDVATSKLLVRVCCRQTGTEATPFS